MATASPGYRGHQGHVGSPSQLESIASRESLKYPNPSGLDRSQNQCPRALIHRMELLEQNTRKLLLERLAEERSARTSALAKLDESCQARVDAKHALATKTNKRVSALYKDLEEVNKAWKSGVASVAQCVRAVQPALDTEMEKRMQMDRSLKALITRSVGELRESVTKDITQLKDDMTKVMLLKDDVEKIHVSLPNNLSKRLATVESTTKAVEGSSNEMPKAHILLDQRINQVTEQIAHIRSDTERLDAAAHRVENDVKSAIVQLNHEIDSSVSHLQLCIREETQKCAELAARDLKQEVARRHEEDTRTADSLAIVQKLQEEAHGQLEKLESRVKEFETDLSLYKKSVERDQLESQRVIAAALEKQTKKMVEKCHELLREPWQEVNYELKESAKNTAQYQCKINDELANLSAAFNKEQDARQDTCERITSIINELQEEVSARATHEKLLENQVFQIRATFEGKISTLMKQVSDEFSEHTEEAYVQQRSLKESIERESNVRREEISKIEEEMNHRLRELDAMSHQQAKQAQMLMTSSTEAQQCVEQGRRQVAEAFRMTDKLKTDFEEFKDEQKLMWGYLEADVKARHVDVLREMQALNCQLMDR